MNYKDRPRSGHPLKLSDKKLKDIVKSVNNRTGVSQRKIAKDSHDLIFEDEKHFNLTGDNVNGNRFFYSTDPATAPTDIKFRKKIRAKGNDMDGHIIEGCFSCVRSQEQTSC
ncbi:unnamed protein product [Rotaria sp. Silwood2]|nr:unnamed protein product [Rotaria sp. Silwood2]